MNRFKAFLLLVFLLPGLVIPARAASDRYSVPEMDLSLTVPSDYLVFSRGTDKNDPALSALDISWEELLDKLSERNIYLNAVRPDGSEEIVVTMSESDIRDLNGMGDTAMQMLASSFQDGYAEAGYSITAYDIYRHSQLEFIRIFFHSTDKTTYCLQYYTVYNGQTMNFTLRSYGAPISGTQEKTMGKIVDSIHLNHYVPAEKTAGETPAFTHRDPDNGTTFTVPANWTTQELSEEEEAAGVDVQFSCAEDPGLMIVYLSADLMEELPFYGKLFLNRETVEALSASVIAELPQKYGALESSLHKKTYNGSEYDIFTIPYTAEVYGAAFSVIATVAVHIENGWIHMFLFLGETTNPHYPEFEQLLSSVAFGQEAPAGFGGKAVLLIAATAILLCMTVLFGRRRKKRKGAAEPKTMRSKTPARPRYVYCHNCGNRLPGNSRFCDVCGTRLRDREE